MMALLGMVSGVGAFLEAGESRSLRSRLCVGAYSKLEEMQRVIEMKHKTCDDFTSPT